MTETIIYQTIALRENQSPDEIEDNGPFRCKKGNAWLGIGHYFWDTHLELAHAWGNHGYKSSYVICQSRVIIDSRCFDLVGNGNHRLQFNKILNTMINHPKYLKHPTVSQVIEHLKELNIFNFEAIRATGSGSFGSIDTMGIPRKLFFHIDQKSTAKMSLFPEIQICLIGWRTLGCEEYKIVFPEDLVENTEWVF